MYIRKAIPGDLDDWISVAKDVAPIFGHLTMAEDPDFLDYVRRKIDQDEALAAQMEDGICAGFMAFSRMNNRINWLGVLSEYRNNGMGSALLQAALAQLDPARDITVETYRRDFTPGLPARHLYEKHGFIQKDDTFHDHLGNPRCRMVIKASL